MKGWREEHLSEVCINIQDGAHRSPQVLYREPGNGRFPYLTSKNVGDGVIKLGNVEYCDAEFHEAIYARCKVSVGDVLLTKDGANTGNVAINTLDEPFSLLSSVCLLKANPALLESKFLFYYLRSEEGLQQITGQMTGTAIKRIILKTIRASKIPLPPLHEQRRIVGILDEAFAGIATAKANTEKNLRNAREVFESYLQNVFIQRGDGWIDTKLDDVCRFQNGFAFKSNTFKPSGTPIIRISNIQDGRIDVLNRLVFFDPKDYRENLDRYRIVEGDLLIAMSGATTGKVGFNTESTVFYLNQRVGKFEPSGQLIKRFLYHFLSTKVAENLRISAGAAQPNLSTEQIKAFMIPLPSIEEQVRIVNALDTLSEDVQQLESLFQQKLAALDALKKSLLHQAFSGKL